MTASIVVEMRSPPGGRSPPRQRSEPILFKVLVGQFTCVLCVGRYAGVTPVCREAGGICDVNSTTGDWAGFVTRWNRYEETWEARGAPAAAVGAGLGMPPALCGGAGAAARSQ